jgi:hypothetical protein
MGGALGSGPPLRLPLALAGAGGFAVLGEQASGWFGAAVNLTRRTHRARTDRPPHPNGRPMTSTPDIEPSSTVHDPIHHVAHAFEREGENLWVALLVRT